MEKEYKKHHMTVIGWLWVWKVKLHQYIVKDIALYIAKLLYNEPIDLRRIVYSGNILMCDRWINNSKRYSYFDACGYCLRFHPCFKHPYEHALRQLMPDKRLSLMSKFIWFHKAGCDVNVFNLQRNDFLFVGLPNVYETITHIKNVKKVVIVTTDYNNIYKYRSRDTVYVFNV